MVISPLDHMPKELRINLQIPGFVESLLLPFIDFTIHRHLAQPGWRADAGLVVDGGEKRRKALHDISDGAHCISRALSLF